MQSLKSRGQLSGVILTEHGVIQMGGVLAVKNSNLLRLFFIQTSSELEPQLGIALARSNWLRSKPELLICHSLVPILQSVPMFKMALSVESWKLYCKATHTTATLPVSCLSLVSKFLTFQAFKSSLLFCIGAWRMVVWYLLSSSHDLIAIPPFPVTNSMARRVTSSNSAH